jgi:hypothetical protein
MTDELKRALDTIARPGFGETDQPTLQERLRMWAAGVEGGHADDTREAASALDARDALLIEAVTALEHYASGWPPSGRTQALAALRKLKAAQVRE